MDESELRQRLETVFKEHTIWAPSPERFNDPFEAGFTAVHEDERVRRILGSAARQALFQHGLVCFAGVAENHLMWAHYARNHVGYCVEYERIDSAILSGTACRKVEYDQRPVEYDGDTTKLKRAFFRKSTHWAYEKEWRIVWPNPNETLPVGTVIPSGVILGLRTPTAAKSIIREVASSVRVGQIEIAGGYEIAVRWD